MHSLELQLLGPLRIGRAGVTVDLPGSRKVRALLAYLTLSPNPPGRAQLCDLLWDVADDPRGELRWCLSKIRSLLGEERVVVQGDTIALDLSECCVDAIEIAAAYHHGFRTQSPEQLKLLAELFAGDFLDGLVVERNPAFDTWLVSQRRQFRDIHAALLEHIVQRFSSEDGRPYLDRWIRLAPFDLCPQEILLKSLAMEGRIREGEEHVTATSNLFSAEGLDIRPLREIWRVARTQADESFRPSTATSLPAAPVPTPVAQTAPDAQHRASIAIMPFEDMSAVTIPGGPADALVHDIIMRLAKLRSLRVIAQGTMFALKGRQHTASEVAQMLSVDYVVNGSFHKLGERASVRVELTDARTSAIVWADQFEHKASEILSLLEEIGLRIVLSIEREVETIESNRAILKPPNSMNAWEAHHRGLSYMYRFTQADNDAAHQYFQAAVKLDPTFARAHAGLSFTHFQNAFQGWADHDKETELAYRTACQSMMIDDRDPTAHWALGRAVWLKGMYDQSMDELEQATALSPNFALAYYYLAFIQAQSGDPEAAVVAADRSRELSPFDPLLFGMLASRARALARLGRFDEAADSAVKAAHRPNAHVHVLAVAALVLSFAGRIDEARMQVRLVRQRQAGYNVKDFFRAFHILPADEQMYQAGAKLIGLA